ncbi:hypothetical protein P154DRAFT_281595 [Amniculicola lignicola CBS 123094]|uniref:Uncharacterized protein n=1 Tax=Amniculicola lignicola CBS 123094 TaxID=1392246 RepID=A0A6A5W9G1_9PLEO|nr:hypothetical protein P154DRAFT_281595 [Amniculicola lignicola CBS 123094]
MKTRVSALHDGRLAFAQWFATDCVVAAARWHVCVEVTCPHLLPAPLGCSKNGRGLRRIGAGAGSCAAGEVGCRETVNETLGSRDREAGASWAQARAWAWRSQAGMQKGRVGLRRTAWAHASGAQQRDSPHPLLLSIFAAAPIAPVVFVAPVHL